MKACETPRAATAKLPMHPRRPCCHRVFVAHRSLVLAHPNDAEEDSRILKDLSVEPQCCIQRCQKFERDANRPLANRKISHVRDYRDVARWRRVGRFSPLGGWDDDELAFKICVGPLDLAGL